MELMINTHPIVSELGQIFTSTHAMVSDILRTIVHSQEVNDGKPLVSNIRATE